MISIEASGSTTELVKTHSNYGKGYMSVGVDGYRINKMVSCQECSKIEEQSS